MTILYQQVINHNAYYSLPGYRVIASRRATQSPSWIMRKKKKKNETEHGRYDGLRPGQLNFRNFASSYAKSTPDMPSSSSSTRRGPRPYRHFESPDSEPL